MVGVNHPCYSDILAELSEILSVARRLDIKICDKHSKSIIITRTLELIEKLQVEK